MMALDDESVWLIKSQRRQIKFLKASGTPLSQVEDWYFYIRQRDRFKDTYEIPVQILLSPTEATSSTPQDQRNSTHSVNWRGRSVSFDPHIANSTYPKDNIEHSRMSYSPMGMSTHDPHVTTRCRFSFANTPRDKYLTGSSQETQRSSARTYPTTNLGTPAHPSFSRSIPPTGRPPSSPNPPLGTGSAVPQPAPLRDPYHPLIPLNLKAYQKQIDCWPTLKVRPNQLSIVRNVCWTKTVIFHWISFGSRRKHGTR